MSVVRLDCDQGPYHSTTEPLRMSRNDYLSQKLFCRLSQDRLAIRSFPAVIPRT